MQFIQAIPPSIQGSYYAVSNWALMPCRQLLGGTESFLVPEKSKAYLLTKEEKVIVAFQDKIEDYRRELPDFKVTPLNLFLGKARHMG